MLCYNTAHPATLYDSLNRGARDQQNTGKKGLWEITQNNLVGAAWGSVVVKALRY